MMIIGMHPVPESQRSKPVPNPEWLNRTINIDNGCVFGGKLTALRHPEKELVSVAAKATYAEPRRPFCPKVWPPAAG